jgi:hypothetical protein
MVFRRHVRSVLLVLGLSLFSAVAWAAPSHEDPEAPLAVRPEPVCQQLVAEADTLYRGLRESIGEWQAKVSNSQLRQVKPGQVVEAYAKMLQLGRVAGRLIILGEPAGMDYQFRARQAQQELSQLINAFDGLPGVQEQINRAFAAIRREAEKSASILPKVQKLSQAGQLDEAETMFYKAFDPLESKGVWYKLETRRPVMEKFWQTQEQLDRALRESRQKEARDALTKARQAKTPNFSQLLAQLRQATAAIRQNGKAEVGGQSLTGPQVAAQFCQQWQQAQQAALACRALDWARTTQLSANDLAQLTDQQAQFSRDATPALAELVQAEAAHAQAADAKSLYREYLTVLAPLANLPADAAAPTAWDKALEQLIAKSPPLAAEVAVYRGATSELLRWRKRTAEAYTRARKAQSPPLEDVYLQGIRSSGETAGLLLPSATNTSQTELSSPAPNVMPMAAKKLLGQRAMVTGLIGNTEAKSTVSRYRQRCFASFALPEPLAKEVAALEADLLATKTAAPLTLEAAAALASARRGDLAAASGEIQGIYMEALAPLFAAPPPIAANLIPLGPLPGEAIGNDPLVQMVVHFDLKPLWVQQDYFFLQVQAP